jgi:hypothetical protein
MTNSAPTNQTVTAGSGSAPLIVFGCYGATTSIATRTFSTTADEELNANGAGPGEPFIYLNYKIYNSSPANTTIGMNEEGDDNGLQSFYMECS